MPNPPSDGGAQAIHNTTLGFLKIGVDIDVLAINPSRNFVDVNSLDTAYVKNTNFKAVLVDTSIRRGAILANFFKRESYFIERFRSKHFEEVLIETISNKQYDIIQLEHLYLFLYIDSIRKHSGAKIIFRPQNVEYIIWERYLNNERHPFRRYFLRIATKRLKRFEQQFAAQCDGIIALTKDDEDIFNSFQKKTTTTNIPMGFNYNELVDYNFEEQYISAPQFYHLGSMDWMPNEEAVKWFVDAIFPIVVAKEPSIRIYIAGRNMQEYFFKKQSENLIVEGTINNPISYQADKAVMIVPLLSGSGIRAKIVEGLALGKTIITTTVGAQGIRYTDGENLLIGDTPEAFAQHILDCYNSKSTCERIGVNAAELSKQYYHYESVAEALKSFYLKILNA